MKETTKCIICLAPAVSHCGHVLSVDNEEILAGFCSNHSDTHLPDHFNREGCVGAYHPLMEAGGE